MTLTAGTGLTGGGDISANRTFAVDGLLEDLDTLGANSGDSEFIVGTGAGALAWESGATARTSIGLGTADTPQFASLGLNVAAPTDGLLRTYDATINTTANYHGSYNVHIKTAGVTDYDDLFLGFENWTGYNQSGGVLGSCYAIHNEFRLSDGDVGDGSNARSLNGIYNFLNLDGGKVYGNVFGSYVIIDQEAANEITGDIYGIRADITVGGTLGGDSYQLVLTGTTDYGIWQSGQGINYLTGNVGIAENNPQDELEVNGKILVKDKLCFTQDDRNEYIDSLADGYMDYGATTGHRININGAYEYTLPVADGSTDEIIKTNGSGTLSFIRAPKAIYAELSDSADQTFAQTATPYSITFDTNDEIAGITHSTSSNT